MEITLKEREEMARIKNAVIDYFQVSEIDFDSKDRSFELAFARQYFFYLCDLYLNIRPANIGRMAGDRDRTTVLHGIRKIQNFIHVGSDDARHLDPLRSLITSISFTI